VGEKRSETRHDIHQDWAQGKTIELMFQDAARFGRKPGYAQMLGAQAMTPNWPRPVDARIHLRLWRSGCLYGRTR